MIENLSDKLDMGHHAPYVWSSYAIFFIAVLILLIYALKTLKQAKKRLVIIEKNIATASKLNKQAEEKHENT